MNVMTGTHQIDPNHRVINTAVLLAAGRGSRRMPITSVIDKAMLPIGNRPTIDYAVEQCVEAGIRRIVFVVVSGDSLIIKYYGSKISIEETYPWLGVKGTVTCEYIIQPIDEKAYGTAPAVGVVREKVGNESFITLGADGFIEGSKEPIVKKMIEAFIKQQDITTVIAGLKIPGKDAKAYAVMNYSDDHRLIDLDEKPAHLEDHTLHSANVSYYLFSPDIFAHIDKLEAVNGEYRVTDAINTLADEQKVLVVPVDGVYMDSGQLHTWVSANQRILER